MRVNHLLVRKDDGTLHAGLFLALIDKALVPADAITALVHISI